VKKGGVGICKMATTGDGLSPANSSKNG
jgi:hypothetical protein